MKRIHKIFITVAVTLILVSLASSVCMAYAVTNQSKVDDAYEITVVDKYGETFSIKGRDIDIQMKYGGFIDNIIYDTPTRIRLMEALSRYGIKLPYTATFDRDKLTEILTQQGLFDDTRVNPVNAYIDTSYANGKFEIVKEVEGTAVDKDKILENLGDAICDLESDFIMYDEGVYKEADIKSEDLEDSLNELQKLTNFSITYKYGNKTLAYNQAYMAKFVTYNTEAKKWEVKVESIDKFMDELYNTFNTYKKQLNFKTTDGRDIVVPGGNWGWNMNTTDTRAKLVEQVNLQKNANGEIVWKQEAPMYGDKEFNNYIEIDMGKQHLYMYTNGKLVGDWPIVSGMAGDPGRRTPEGVYRLTYKKKNAVLRGPTWESPVKYWMPFNGGIGMHDANWQPSFGGEAYKWRGSHGCINMPTNGAKAVYDAIDKSYAIICFY